MADKLRQAGAKRGRYGCHGILRDDNHRRYNYFANTYKWQPEKFLLLVFLSRLWRICERQQLQLSCIHLQHCLD